MTDEQPRIITSVDGPVGHLTFSNPKKHNAMTLDMWREVPEACRSLMENREVRVVLFHGAGQKAFVAGADISQFSESRTSTNSNAYTEATADAYGAIKNVPVPTVAAIQGLCIGGGLALALCTDVRVASEDSRFGLPPAKLGLGYPQDGIDDVVNVVGPSIAKHLIYTADLFDAETAHSWGLVSQVYPSADFASQVETMASTISQRAPMTLKAAKLAVNASVSRNDADRTVAAGAIAAATASADYTEGVAAFMERRSPRFKGE